MSQITLHVNDNSLFATCEKCGCESAEIYEVDGVLMCEDCMRLAGYERCEDCGEWFLTSEMYETEDGYVCEDCRDRNYTLCEECGKYVPNYSFIEVNYRNGWRWESKFICRDCVYGDDRYYRCEDCGEWYDSESVPATYITGNGYVCEGCLDNYYMCEDCGEYFSEWQICYDDEEEAYYCQSCMRNHNRDNSRIHPYSYKPEPKFLTHFAEKGVVYEATNILDLTFGVELEVDKGDYDERADAIREISEASDDVYMKSDGSLDTGFEIVTHPATLNYHMMDFSWRQICQIAKDHGFKSHDARTCGLHVHVGRYQLGDDYASRRATIANVLLLVDRHWDMLVKFSRRKVEQLNHWAVRPQISKPCAGDSEEDAREKALCADNRNRYQAINLNNEGTIEFRLFNGSLKRDTIIATLQMVSNICSFAKNKTTAECLASTWEDITTYAHYDELDTYLRDRGIVTANNPDAVDVYDAEETPKTHDYTSYAYDGEDDRTSDYEYEYETEYEPRFPVGSRVICARGMYAERLRGLTGTVVVPDIDEDGSNVGIRFDNYATGHSLNGRLGDDATDGWWVYTEDLELVA